MEDEELVEDYDRRTPKLIESDDEEQKEKDNLNSNVL